ncbi:hypothetical protein [Planctomycetes bacterium K23_9]|uniref:Uncharacterized protein n=1 Tax=Stieleria marina TaxID=1930275 RepID=A0A517NPC0_9BACT|nr:hypothetical protein K239x_09100 [Planctomycetes bacterium K23_9]
MGLSRLWDAKPSDSAVSQHCREHHRYHQTGRVLRAKTSFVALYWGSDWPQAVVWTAILCRKASVAARHVVMLQASAYS